jgi:hypothetical protein
MPMVFANEWVLKAVYEGCRSQILDRKLHEEEVAGCEFRDLNIRVKLLYIYLVRHQRKVLKFIGNQLIQIFKLSLSFNRTDPSKAF